jgi:hypothetical protein
MSRATTTAPPLLAGKGRAVHHPSGERQRANRCPCRRGPGTSVPEHPARPRSLRRSTTPALKQQSPLRRHSRRRRTPAEGACTHGVEPHGGEPDEHSRAGNQLCDQHQRAAAASGDAGREQTSSTLRTPPRLVCDHEEVAIRANDTPPQRPISLARTLRRSGRRNRTPGRYRPVDVSIAGLTSRIGT